MAASTVYYIGTEAQVAHHAEPLREFLPVQIVGAEEITQRARPGDVAIVFSEHFHPTRQAVRQLRQQQVATLYAIDGILEWRNAWENRSDEPASPYCMRPVLSHKVACIGASQARTLAAWGNAEKVEQVGLPRLDRLLRGSSPTAGSARAATAEVGRGGARTAWRVLVTTAKWPGFTDAQVALARQALWDLKEWFAAHPHLGGRSLQVTWRLTHGLADEIGVPNELRDLTGQDMAAAVAASDALITTPSTAMLEAMLGDRPVALLDYNPVPHYVPAAWEIFSREHLDRVLPLLVDPPPHRLAWQREILHDTLACESPATPRFVRLVQLMAEHATAAVHRDQPLHFPPDLLETQANPCDAPASAPQASQLPFGDVYREPAFGEEDPRQLQVELADAQRELQLREGELRQARAELAQAHAIFDRIHANPVTGPLVRCWQWLQRRRQPRATCQTPPAESSSSTSNSSTSIPRTSIPAKSRPSAARLPATSTEPASASHSASSAGRSR